MTMNNVIWLNHRDIMHPRAGGAERTIYEISTRLVKKGYKVLWLSTLSGGLSTFQEIDGVEIHRLGGNVSAHIRNLLFEQKYGKDTVIVDDMAHVVPWMSERFTKHTGTVFFRHLHRRTLDGQLTSFKAGILKRMESNYPRFYKEWPFVTESQQSVQDLRDMGISADRIVRIPPGVNYHRLKPKEKYTEPSLVYFGGMRDYKRPYEALYLVESLKNIYPDIKLRVSGDGPSLLPMKSLANRIGLGENVEFMGRLDEDSLFDIVSRSWLNLHFSVAEGWGYSILEAAACGTPTVAYSVPGVEEAIEDGKNGIKVRDNDRQKFEKAAELLLGEYATWPKACRDVAEKYSWDSTADLWENHLLSLK